MVANRHSTIGSLTGREIAARLHDARPVDLRPLLGFDTTIASRGPRLHVPDTRSARDAWIATGLVHLTIVRCNVADFDGTGATRLDPWTFKIEML